MSGQRRCRFFLADGRPKGRGCDSGSECRYVHPDSPSWSMAPTENPASKGGGSDHQSSNHTTSNTSSTYGSHTDSGWGGGQGFSGSHSVAATTSHANAPPSSGVSTQGNGAQWGDATSSTRGEWNTSTTEHNGEWDSWGHDAANADDNTSATTEQDGEEWNHLTSNKNAGFDASTEGNNGGWGVDSRIASSGGWGNCAANDNSMVVDPLPNQAPLNAAAFDEPSKGKEKDQTDHTVFRSIEPPYGRRNNNQVHPTPSEQKVDFYSSKSFDPTMTSTSRPGDSEHHKHIQPRQPPVAPNGRSNILMSTIAIHVEVLHLVEQIKTANSLKDKCEVQKADAAFRRYGPAGQCEINRKYEEATQELHRLEQLFDEKVSALGSNVELAKDFIQMKLAVNNEVLEKYVVEAQGIVSAVRSIWLQYESDTTQSQDKGGPKGGKRKWAETLKLDSLIKQLSVTEAKLANGMAGKVQQVDEVLQNIPNDDVKMRQIRVAEDILFLEEQREQVDRLAVLKIQAQNLAAQQQRAAAERAELKQMQLKVQADGARQQEDLMNAILAKISPPPCDLNANEQVTKAIKGLVDQKFHEDFEPLINLYQKETFRKIQQDHEVIYAKVWKLIQPNVTLVDQVRDLLDHASLSKQ